MTVGTVVSGRGHSVPAPTAPRHGGSMLMLKSKRFSKTRQAEVPVEVSTSSRGTTIQSLQAKVEKAVKAAGQGDCRVHYHAYDLSSEGRPQDNLSKVAVLGKVLLVSSVEDGVPHYQSRVLYSPTWLDVALEVNLLLCVTGWHECSFEGLEETMPKTTKQAAKLLKKGIEVHEVLLGS